MSHEHEPPSHEALGRHDTVAPAESPASKAVLAAAAQSGVDLRDALTRFALLDETAHLGCWDISDACRTQPPAFVDTQSSLTWGQGHWLLDALTADIPAWAHAAR